MTDQTNPSPNPNIENRRSVRSVLINRPMQREFTLITIAIMMLSAVIVSFLIHSTIHESIMDSIGRTGRIGAYNLLSDVSYELIFRVVVVFFFTILAVALFGIFFLHRVAGPAYRFHQVFKRMAHDEIPQDMTLRDKDFFKEIAGELNLVFKLLRARKRAVEEVESIVASISEANAPSEMKDKLRQIRTALKEAHHSPS